MASSQYQYSNTDLLAEEAIDNTKLTIFKPDPDIDLKDGKGKSELDDLAFSGFTADKDNVLGKSDLGAISDELVFEPLKKDELKDFKLFLDTPELKDFDPGGVITSRNLDGSIDSLLIDPNVNKPEDLLKDYLPKQKHKAIPDDLDKSSFAIDDIPSLYGDLNGELELPSSWQNTSNSLLSPTTSKTKTKTSTSQPLSWTSNGNEPIWKSVVGNPNLTTSKTQTSTNQPLSWTPKQSLSNSSKTANNSSLNSTLTPVRQYICVFDEEYYLESNPDVAKLKIEPLTHYLFLGKLQGRSPSALCEHNSLDTLDLTTTRTDWDLNSSDLYQLSATDL